MTNIDELFAPMKEAPVTGRGNYMSAGVYEVSINKVFQKDAFSGNKLFICEFTVEESNNDAHKPGTTGTWAPKLNGVAATSTFGDIKCLLFACMGKNGRDVPASDKDSHAFVAVLARAICGSETAKKELKALGVEEDAASLVIGTRVKLECAQTRTKAGHPFTRHTWSPAK